jgi:NDP-sugar pyrophosphorylase family protein/aminoglycoside/choline kinase family phosphotransferase
MKPINIFIPSAGLGERLRPITEHIPKPLIPILGKPILEIILEKVSALPVNRIGINLHHKREEIEGWIKESAFRANIKIFHEETILGTGGGLKNAEDFLRDSNFLVYNSDILSDIDLEDIINFHLSSGNIGTLAVHDYPELNNVAIDEKGTFLGVRSSEFGVWGLVQNSKLKTLSPQSLSRDQNSKMVAFTGIAIYSPLFLKFLPEGKTSVVDGWLNAIASGYRIGTVDVTGSYWKDIGTPEAYFTTVLDALRKEGEILYIHPTATVREDVGLDGYGVIEERCKVDKRVSLKNTIIFPETKIEENSSYENCIIGPGFRVGIDTPISSRTLIGTGGSDRSYYRIERAGGSAILMEAREDDPDFERHIEYTKFFRKYSIPVPELIKVNYDEKNALFEDLGDISLYSHLKCPRREEDIERIYRDLIDILISLHTTVTEHISECPLLQNRIFDYEYLQWETDYFIERFVKGIRNIEIKDNTVLEDEFHRLAIKVDSFPKTVIHRDFQSQNIMIQKGGISRIVDYQGARIGPPAYDLVSLLWDPYYRMDDNLRERLINYYINEMKGILEEKFSERDSRETLLPCRLQRHMQALGAYGFLSMVKGKKYFLKYVPEGLRLLKEDALLSKDVYPELYGLVKGL